MSGCRNGMMCLHVDVNFLELLWLWNDVIGAVMKGRADWAVDRDSIGSMFFSAAGWVLETLETNHCCLCRGCLVGFQMFFRCFLLWGAACWWLCRCELGAKVKGMDALNVAVVIFDLFICCGHFVFFLGYCIIKALSLSMLSDCPILCDVGGGASMDHRWWWSCKWNLAASAMLFDVLVGPCSFWEKHGHIFMHISVPCLMTQTFINIGPECMCSYLLICHMHHWCIYIAIQRPWTNIDEIAEGHCHCGWCSANRGVCVVGRSSTSAFHSSIEWTMSGCRNGMMCLHVDVNFLELLWLCQFCHWESDERNVSVPCLSLCFNLTTFINIGPECTCSYLLICHMHHWCIYIAIQRFWTNIDEIAEGHCHCGWCSANRGVCVGGRSSTSAFHSSIEWTMSGCRNGMMCLHVDVNFLELLWLCQFCHWESDERNVSVRGLSLCFNLTTFINIGPECMCSYLLICHMHHWCIYIAIQRFWMNIDEIAEGHCHCGWCSANRGVCVVGRSSTSAFHSSIEWTMSGCRNGMMCLHVDVNFLELLWLCQFCHWGSDERNVSVPCLSLCFNLTTFINIGPECTCSYLLICHMHHWCIYIAIQRPWTNIDEIAEGHCHCGWCSANRGVCVVGRSSTSAFHSSIEWTMSGCSNGMMCLHVDVNFLELLWLCQFCHWESDERNVSVPCLSLCFNLTTFINIGPECMCSYLLICHMHHWCIYIAIQRFWMNIDEIAEGHCHCGWCSANRGVCVVGRSSTSAFHSSIEWTMSGCRNGMMCLHVDVNFLELLWCDCVNFVIGKVMKGTFQCLAWACASIWQHSSTLGRSVRAHTCSYAICIIDASTLPFNDFGWTLMKSLKATATADDAVPTEEFVSGEDPAPRLSIVPLSGQCPGVGTAWCVCM